MLLALPAEIPSRCWTSAPRRQGYRARSRNNASSKWARARRRPWLTVSRAEPRDARARPADRDESTGEGAEARAHYQIWGSCCLSVLPETCLPIPVWLQFYCLERELLERAPVAKVVCRKLAPRMSSTLKLGQPTGQKVPTSSAARAGGRRNVIMSLSPKLPKSHNFEALRANTTSTALEK